MDTDAILDSSVIVALVTPEKHSEWTSNNIQKHQNFHVLDLSFYEVANAIEHKVSAGFDAKDATAAFKQAGKMMNLFTVHNFSEVIIDSLNIALEQKIAVYDAAFLSLADKLKMPFLTLDMKLAKNLEHTKYDQFVEYPNKTSHKQQPTLKEAVSWGKINEKAKRIMIEGDATVIMPIMTSALLDRLGKRK